MVFTVAAQTQAIASARHTRHALAEQLTAWGLAEHCDDVELITAELVTNAVRHGGGVHEVTLRATGDVIRIEVTDAGDGQPQLREAETNAFGGRGLALVEALSSSWGVKDQSEGGKTVWAEIHA